VEARTKRKEKVENEGGMGKKKCFGEVKEEQGGDWGEVGRGEVRRYGKGAI